MRVEEVLRLHDNGWTKEEIQALINSESTQATPNAAEPAVQTVETPAATPVAHTESVAAAQMKEAEAKSSGEAKTVYQLTDKQLQELAQGISIKAAGGVFETTKDFSQTLDEHFQSLLKGE